MKNLAEFFKSQMMKPQKPTVGQRVENATNRFENDINSLYGGWEKTGDQSRGMADLVSNQMFGMRTPEAQLQNNGFIQQLMQQNQNRHIPQMANVSMPTGPDYQAARDSNMFRQMQDRTVNQARNNAALSGGSVRGGNTNLGIASGARSNLVNSANQLYQNDLANYNNAMAQNQLRNNMLGSQFGNQMNLQKLMNNNQLMNYQNQMGQYGLEQQKIRDYLTQLNSNANQGFGNLNTFGSLYQNTLNSKIGSLNSITAAINARKAGKAQINAAADARLAQGLQMVGTIAGTAIGGPLGGAIGGMAGGLAGGAATGGF
jgi:hypothetical protein